MTYVVGYSPHKDDACALSLAAQLARSDKDSVHAVTVVPQGWEVAAGSATDGDFTAWAQGQGEASAEEALTLLGADAGVPIAASWVTGRSVPAALLEQVEALDADMIVVGSGANGAPGRVAMTAKTDRLLHSSPVPVAIAPRGYAAEPGSRVTRVTVGFRDDDATWHLLQRVADICRRTGASLRLVTVALDRPPMYTAAVSGAEDLVREQWRRQASAAQDEAVEHLVDAGFARDEVETVLARGATWVEALDSVEWHSGDVLVVGSSSTHLLTQVFLGSSAAKIVRASPVPVVVVP